MCVCHALCARIIKTLWFTCGKRAEGWGRSDLWDAAREDRGGRVTDREDSVKQQQEEREIKGREPSENKWRYGKEFGA